MSQELDILLSIRQQNGKLLKDYVAQFKIATIKIYNLDEPIAIIAMKRRFRSSRFTYFLDKIYPKSYSKLLTHAQKYTCMENAIGI